MPNPLYSLLDFDSEALSGMEISSLLASVNRLTTRFSGFVLNFKPEFVESLQQQMQDLKPGIFDFKHRYPPHITIPENENFTAPSQGGSAHYTNCHLTLEFRNQGSAYIARVYLGCEVDEFNRAKEVSIVSIDCRNALSVHDKSIQPYNERTSELTTILMYVLINSSLIAQISNALHSVYLQAYASASASASAAAAPMASSSAARLASPSVLTFHSGGDAKSTDRSSFSPSRTAAAPMPTSPAPLELKLSKDDVMKYCRDFEKFYQYLLEEVSIDARQRLINFMHTFDKMYSIDSCYGDMQELYGLQRFARFFTDNNIEKARELLGKDKNDLLPVVKNTILSMYCIANEGSSPELIKAIVTQAEIMLEVMQKKAATTRPT